MTNNNSTPNTINIFIIYRTLCCIRCTMTVINAKANNIPNKITVVIINPPYFLSRINRQFNLSIFILRFCYHDTFNPSTFIIIIANQSKHFCYQNSCFPLQ
jgi:hypothetical protein